MHFNKAYVICVAEKSPDRLRRFFRNCRRAGVSAELFPAVNGASIDTMDWQQNGYLTQDFKLKMPGSLGCLLSHVVLWEKIAADASVEIALICEDDAELIPDFLIQLKNISWDEVPSDWDVIRLACHKRTGEFVSANLLKAPIVLRKGINAGTFCYLMKAASAEKLKSVLIPYSNQQSMDVLLKSRTDQYRLYILKRPLAKETRFRYSIRRDLNLNYGTDRKIKRFFVNLLGKIFK